MQKYLLLTIILLEYPVLLISHKLEPTNMAGYVGRIERRSVKYFVLKMSTQGMKASSKGGISENNFWKKDKAV